MGLCLGFSGLSFMEVIYFFTLRAWWASRRRNEILKVLREKISQGWRKVKALNAFENDQERVLNQQVQNNNFLSPFSIYGKEEGESPENGNISSSINSVNYKNIFGDI